MRERTELQELFEEILGSKNVYFQPPATVRLKYPCIIYSKDRFRPWRADNSVYIMHRPYSVKLIYKNPDSDLPEKLARLPYCEHGRHYTADNLYHDTYTLYF